ncbi:MAG: AI-2E family transporter [Candidatus Nanopelagicales bacterium]|jgi:predicted PurR-regulated permease PerM|nr:AI-2E family transporter [Candidatus Nanopelagicales bacterium]
MNTHGSGELQPDISANSASGGRWNFSINPRFIQKSIITILVLVVALQLVLWAFSKSRDFLFLLLLAWLLGIAISPVVDILTKRGLKRGLSTFLVLLALMGLIFAFIASFGQLLGSQLASLITQIPTLIEGFVGWLNTSFNLKLDASSIEQSLNISNSQITNFAQDIAGGIFGVVSSIFTFIFNIFTLLLFAFYFAADAPRIKRTIGSWLPTKQQVIFTTVWQVATDKTGGFVISRVILAALNSVFTSVFLLLLDVPYWLPLGLFTGLISQFVPTVGTYLGGVIPTIVAVVNDPKDGLFVIIFISVYQQIENYLFAPRISSLTMDIHPAVAFASVIIFAGFFGAIGALIGIPIAAAIISIVQTYGKRYELIPELHKIETKS